MFRSRPKLSSAYDGRVFADSEVSVPAALIGEPARAAMLVALLDGRSRPAGELARTAGVSAGTASEHLSRLTAGGLTTVTRSGRHRYYRLSGHEVARALEALQALAPPRPVRSLRDARTGSALVLARSCYDHLAGELAIHIADGLTRRAVLARLIPGEKGTLLDAAHPLLAQLGLDVPVRNPTRRPMVRGCLDWSERQPHLAGHLGADVLNALITRGWLKPARTSRALHISDDGRLGLTQILGLDPAALNSAPATRALEPGARGALVTEGPAGRAHAGRVKRETVSCLGSSQQSFIVVSCVSS